MPQPIMKKYKHGEMGDAYAKAPKEKLDSSLTKTYSQGELGSSSGKAPKEKLEAWSKENGCETSYNWDAGETSYCASNANGTGPFKITFREQDVRTVFEKNNDTLI